MKNTDNLYHFEFTNKGGREREKKSFFNNLKGGVLLNVTVEKLAFALTPFLQAKLMEQHIIDTSAGKQLS
jgi:hypothetical protein